MGGNSDVVYGEAYGREGREKGRKETFFLEVRRARHKRREGGGRKWGEGVHSHPPGEVARGREKKFIVVRGRPRVEGGVIGSVIIVLILI